MYHLATKRTAKTSIPQKCLKKWIGSAS